MPKAKKIEEAGRAERILSWLSEALAFSLKLSVWIAVFSFLVGGAFASIMLLARLYPDSLIAVMAFIVISEIFGRVAFLSIILLIIAASAHTILKNKRTKE